MPTPRERELNRTRVARWRAANPDRARQQWRAYYYRRGKLVRLGIDPAVIAATTQETR